MVRQKRKAEEATDKVKSFMNRIRSEATPFTPRVFHRPNIDEGPDGQGGAGSDPPPAGGAGSDPPPALRIGDWMQEWCSFWKNTQTGEASWETPDAPADAETQPLWAEHWSEEYGRPFWCRSDTGETTWIKPQDESLMLEAAVDVDPLGAEVPGWERKWSEEHERPFWRNETTEELTWIQPGAEEADDTEEEAFTTVNALADKIEEIPGYEMGFSEQYQRPFWKNVSTGEATWIRPEPDLNAAARQLMAMDTPVSDTIDTVAAPSPASPSASDADVPDWKKARDGFKDVHGIGTGLEPEAQATFEIEGQDGQSVAVFRTDSITSTSLSSQDVEPVGFAAGLQVLTDRESLARPKPARDGKARDALARPKPLRETAPRKPKISNLFASTRRRAPPVDMDKMGGGIEDLELQQQSREEEVGRRLQPSLRLHTPCPIR
jgi:hypothetical protein